MTSVLSVSAHPRKELLADFKSKRCIGSWTTAGAVFLIVPALIVIFSGALVLTLPGVNAMRQVILPAFLPAGGAILLSLPLILISCKKRGEIARIRDKQVDQIQGILGSRNFKSFSLDQNIAWIEKHLVEEGEHPQYNFEWLNAIKERLPEKTKADKDDPFIKAADKAAINLFKKKSKKGKETKKGKSP